MPMISDTMEAHVLDLQCETRNFLFCCHDTYPSSIDIHLLWIEIEGEKQNINVYLHYGLCGSIRLRFNFYKLVITGHQLVTSY